MQIDTPSEMGQMRLNQTISTLNRMQANRWLALMGGGVLLVLGLRRRSLLSMALVPIGIGMVMRAARISGDGYQGSVSVPYKEGICVEKSVTINKSPEELYAYWRAFENLPRFMKHLQSVQPSDMMRSHWVANAPMGQIIQWDAEVINEVPNELIGWRSLPGADVPNAGSVHFERMPMGRGTMVKVEMEYKPPADGIGHAFLKMFGQDPGRTVQEDLRHFKEIMEAGEIPTTEGQPHGSRNVMSKFA